MLYTDKMKIIQKQKDCIGCGTCVVLCPDFWEMDEGGKAKPKQGRRNEKTGDYEFEIEDSKGVCNKDAAEACPVQIISII